MDNKRWGKRFSTIFWWSLIILPFVVALIQFVGYHLTFNSGISTASELITYQGDTSGTFINLLKGSSASFSSYSIPFLRTAFSNLFVNLGLNTYESGQVLGPLFAWMSSVLMYHVMFDFFAWLPRMCHNWIERWCTE